jgi:hypothetical protein
MKLGDRVISFKGNRYGASGVLRLISRQEVDEQGNKCIPFNIFRVVDSNGAIIFEKEANFRLLKSFFTN